MPTLDIDNARVGDVNLGQIETTIANVTCENAYTVIGDPIDTAGLSFYGITGVVADANGARFQAWFANSPDFSDEKAGAAITVASGSPGQTSGQLAFRYLRIKAQNLTTDVVATLTVRAYFR